MLTSYIPNVLPDLWVQRSLDVLSHDINIPKEEYPPRVPPYGRFRISSGLTKASDTTCHGGKTTSRGGMWGTCLGLKTCAILFVRAKITPVPPPRCTCPA